MANISSFLDGEKPQVIDDLFSTTQVSTQDYSALLKETYAEFIKPATDFSSRKEEVIMRKKFMETLTDNMVKQTTMSPSDQGNFLRGPNSISSMLAVAHVAGKEPEWNAALQDTSSILSTISSLKTEKP